MARKLKIINHNTCEILRYTPFNPLENTASIICGVKKRLTRICQVLFHKRFQFTRYSKYENYYSYHL